MNVLLFLTLLRRWMKHSLKPTEGKLTVDPEGARPWKLSFQGLCSRAVFYESVAFACESESHGTHRPSFVSPNTGSYSVDTCSLPHETGYIPNTHAKPNRKKKLPSPTTAETSRQTLSFTSQRESPNRNSHPHQKHEEEGSGATLNKLFSRLLFVIRDSLTRCQPVPDAVGEQGP